MLKNEQVAMITMVAALIAASILLLPMLGINLPTREAAVAPMECAMVKEGTYDRHPIPKDIEEPLRTDFPGTEGVEGRWFEGPIRQTDFVLGMGTPCPHMKIGEARALLLGDEGQEPESEPYIRATLGVHRGEILYPFTTVFGALGDSLERIRPSYVIPYYVIWDNGETEHIFGTTVPTHEYAGVCSDGIDNDQDGQTDNADLDCSLYG